MLRHARGKYNGKINNADAPGPATRHERSPANKGGRDGPDNKASAPRLVTQCPSTLKLSVARVALGNSRALSDGPAIERVR